MYINIHEEELDFQHWLEEMTSDSEDMGYTEECVAVSEEEARDFCRNHCSYAAEGSCQGPVCEFFEAIASMD